MSGYCSTCNVETRDIFRHRTGERHLSRTAGIRTTPGGSSPYNAGRASAASAHWAARNPDAQYAPAQEDIASWD